MDIISFNPYDNPMTQIKFYREKLFFGICFTAQFFNIQQ